MHAAEEMGSVPPEDKLHDAYSGVIAPFVERAEKELAALENELHGLRDEAGECPQPPAYRRIHLPAANTRHSLARAHASHAAFIQPFTHQFACHSPV